jgi:drug/metabolite transporter (DMT)-like permease
MRTGLFSKNHYWQMTLAAFIFSVSDVLVKPVSSAFPAAGIAFFRFLVGGLILWRVISWRREPLRGNETWLLVARGVTGTVAFLFLTEAISMITLPNAIVLFFTAPLFVVPFSFFFLREPVRKIELVLVGAGFIGIYILINPSSHAFNVGYVYGLLSGCIGAMATVLVRKLRQTNGALTIYFYFCLVGGIFTLPLFAREFRMPDSQQLLFLISIALLLLVAQPLMNHAFKFCKASEGAVILMAEAVFVGIAGVLLFREPVTLRLLAGGVMIVGSGVGLNLMNQRVGPLPDDDGEGNRLQGRHSFFPGP